MVFGGASEVEFKMHETIFFRFVSNRTLNCAASESRVPPPR
jgi:hypothetical protein